MCIYVLDLLSDEICGHTHLKHHLKHKHMIIYMGYIYILISYMIHFVGWLLGFKIKKKETRNKNEMLFFC